MVEIYQRNKKQRGLGVKPLSLFMAIAVSLMGIVAIQGSMNPTKAVDFRTVADDQNFNPFEANKGFSVLSLGDVTLGNGELEGSLAAFGSVQSDKQNYPLVHKVAGLDDYIVPQIDGLPVRLLGNQFIGSGNIAVTNAGAPVGTNESGAGAKLVDVSNLTPSERGDFVRLHVTGGNADSGNLDLEKFKWANHNVSDYQAEKPSVAAYFGDIQTHIANTNKCLSSLYTIANKVEVVSEGDMAFVSDFSTTQPNYIDYKDIAGKIIKMDRAEGYKPSVDAPLVVRVPEGTTELGKLNFEGWSSAASADQDLARYILLDLSQSTGTVTIDGLELGAIWAPQANLHYNSNITTNGQWFAKDVTIEGAGEVHHHTFLGKLPCGDVPVPGVDPSIGTTVKVVG
ncbi:collagen-binding domain-containing protein, partial [Corynebacterium glutamicum]|uniref:collagen-binding domain-containing protein n=1 Tax=Corynebacterium glutamicum TaxID=1718 RepID=UPI003C7D4B7D